MAALPFRKTSPGKAVFGWDAKLLHILVAHAPGRRARDQIAGLAIAHHDDAFFRLNDHRGALNQSAQGLFEFADRNVDLFANGGGPGAFQFGNLLLGCRQLLFELFDCVVCSASKSSIFPCAN